jgi:uncharacterized protein (TIGR00255 family)
VAGRRARVEIRTVNHRWFNLSARLPGECAAAEGEIRDALRREFDRGHVSISVRWADEGTPVAGINWPRVEEVAAVLRELRDRLHLDGEVSVEAVARQADVFGSRSSEGTTVVGWSDLAPVVLGAVAECQAARRREGEALTAELLGRLAELDAAVQRIATRAPERLVGEVTRMRANVTALLDGRMVDAGRLAQEVALMADRLDITEELVRFAAHLSAAREALQGGGPVGKQLGFLAQELGREVNTIGAKANDALIAQVVVQMKGSLEKFREQLENVE